MQKYEPCAGSNIKDAINALVDIANDAHKPAEMDFNGDRIVAHPGDSPGLMYDNWLREIKRRHDEYEKSPKGIAARKAREEARERARRFREAGPHSFSIVDQNVWNSFVEKNKDGYGGAVVHYAAYWAHLMEMRMRKGVKLESIAEEMSHEADVEGITGFQYGCAVSILARVWEHGERLRRWHNVKTQIGNEGEDANEGGGVLNPALIHIER